MENSTFLLTYLLTLAVCITVILLIIYALNKGLRKYFEHLSQDPDIAKFFIKLTNIILFLSGLSYALKCDYNVAENANWLTLTWDAAKQIENSLTPVFMSLIILGITFFILHLVARRINK